MKKRILCILTVLVLCLSLMPVSTLAAITDGEFPKRKGDGEIVAVSKTDDNIDFINSIVSVIDVDHNLWISGGRAFYHSTDGLWETKTLDTYTKVMENVASAHFSQFQEYILSTDGVLWELRYDCLDYCRNGIDSLDQVAGKIMENIEAVSVNARGGTVAAVSFDGTLYTWGDNDFGQLGNGSNEITREPQKIMENVKAVSVGQEFTMAVLDDGSLWTWGYNGNGQLGNGGVGNTIITGFRNSSIPIQTIPTKIMDNVIGISAGSTFASALKSDGTLWMWGEGAFSDSGQTSVPVKILEDVASICAGRSQMAAITIDRQLWIWDVVEFKDFGSVSAYYQNRIDQENVDRTSPVLILDDVYTVSIWARNAVILRTDGSIWHWGWIVDETGFSSGPKGKNYDLPTKVLDGISIFDYGSTEYQTGITVNPTTLNLKVGESAPLTVTILPSNASNKEVRWSSSDPSVATVNNGLVTAVGEGSATITATTVDGGRKASCSVTVLTNRKLSELRNLDYLAFSDFAYKTVNGISKGATVKEILEHQNNGISWDSSFWSARNEILYKELYSQIQDWKLYAFSEDVNTGFYAIALTNDYGEALITYRGSKGITEEIGGNDWYGDWIQNDFPMFFNNEGSQFSQAIEFYQTIRDVYPSTDIAITGHSLGGGLAEIVSAYSGSYAETFNSAPFLDIAYSYHPVWMAENYYGADEWNFVDHVNEKDNLVGTLYLERKPRIVHKDESLSDLPHKLESFLYKDGTTVRFTESSRFPVGVMNWGFFNFNDAPYFLTMGSTRNDNLDGKRVASWTVYAGSGNDGIHSYIGDDIIVAGKGNDTIDGGWGNDDYYYTKGDDLDYICDYSGEDNIYLLGFSASDTITATAKKDEVIVSHNGDPIIRIINSRGLINRFQLIVERNGFFNVSDISNLFRTKDYNVYYDIACPVEIQIRDSAGKTVYTLSDETPGFYDTDFGTFHVYQHSDGHCGKSINLIRGYDIMIQGTDKGTMDISGFFVDQGVPLDAMTISDVPVTQNTSAQILENDDGTMVLALDNNRDGKIDTLSAFTKTDPDSIAVMRFRDVDPSAYYYDAVQWAVDNGITSGTSATTFSPDATCTRAQMVTFLWRTAGCPVVQRTNPFVDVRSDAYYYNAVLWAVKNGITAGTSAARFSPEDTVTRDQAVTFLYRFAGSPDVSGGNAFRDVPGDAYYASAVQWAVSKQVTNGTGATTFSPGAPCTRAQTVTFLYRMQRLGVETTSAEGQSADDGKYGKITIGGHTVYIEFRDT